MKKIMLSLSLVLLFLGLLALAPAASAYEANLTRFGPEVYECEQGQPTRHWAAFRAIDGPAELVLQDDGNGNATIKVNGLEVAGPQDFRGSGEVVLPLNLNQENTIEVLPRGRAGNCLTVRVTQFTEQTDIEITTLMYFGLNTSAFFVQQDFYRTLGILGEIYPAGPETSMTYAQSLGFVGNYWIFVELRSLNEDFPFTPPFIDTVEFRGFSHNPEPPYANLNHIGMAYATFSTTDLDGDYLYLMGQGVEFVSPPTTAPNGERFVFLKDQDGTYLKLIQEGDVSDSGGPDLVRMVNVNMNVADLERAREFYRLLGFTEEEGGTQAGGGAFAAAHGFDHPIEFESVDIKLTGGLPIGPGGAVVQLRQWKTPYDGEPPYGGPVSHLGIDRIHFPVTDLIATINEMNELGFEQLGPIGGSSGAGGIVFFYDPDGIKVEFSGPIMEGGPPPLP
jgi:catechol 2,3-dioxygenase-like lactoylglutathione lyase family enzyme